jgi:hypothetical protein
VHWLEPLRFVDRGFGLDGGATSEASAIHPRR